MGRLILLYERGRKLADGPVDVLGRSMATGGESDSEGRSKGDEAGWRVTGGCRGAGCWEAVVLERGRGSGADEIRLL